jgi:hypothetical protein
MNQQIQALADQAEDYADGIVDQGGEFHLAYTQKLAELIVRECITVARGADGLDATHEAWYLIQEHFEVGGMSTADKKTLIKQLLGVEK